MSAAVAVIAIYAVCMFLGADLGRQEQVERRPEPYCPSTPPRLPEGFPVMELARLASASARFEESRRVIRLTYITPAAAADILHYFRHELEKAHWQVTAGDGYRWIRFSCRGGCGEEGEVLAEPAGGAFRIIIRGPEYRWTALSDDERAAA